MKYFEQRLDEENIKSKKTAWAVACVAIFFALCLLLCIVVMLPLKRTEVQLVVVDKNTGYPTTVTKLAEFNQGNERSITEQEALHKYFARQYIMAHDAYNFYAVREAYATVKMYSTPAVFNDYVAKFRGDNDIEKLLGDKRVLEVKVISMTPQNVVTPFKDGENGVTMQARVERQIREGDAVLSHNSGVVTMTFGYDADLRMDETARNMNPLGFTVTSYRFDADMGVKR